MTQLCMSVQQGLEGRGGGGGRGWEAGWGWSELPGQSLASGRLSAQPASPLNSVFDLLCVLCVTYRASGS